MFEYYPIIEHPENGLMLNVTESAKYLGISRKKFRRIAPPPDYVQQKIYPFWSKRVLDILPLEDDFLVGEVLRKGKACGEYLLAEMDEEDVTSLPTGSPINLYGPKGAERERVTRALLALGIKVTFRSDREANVFSQGISWAVNEWRVRSV